MHILIGPNGAGYEKSIPELSALYPDATFTWCQEWAHLAEAIAGAEAYFGWLTPEAWAAAKALRWVQASSTGVDGFLKLPGFGDSDVILTNARGTHAAPLAEHALAMIFAFTRGIKTYVLHQQAHRWSREVRASGALVELTGSTLGIVGFGSVGQALAKRAAAFGMHIHAVDLLSQDPVDYVERTGAEDDLDALLAASDYVVITVPLTAKTRGMISAARLARMKPSAILVGISRGGVIDEPALIAALHEGRIAAAALDVFEEEPLPTDSPLWDMDNVLITPHAAGGSQYEASTICDIFKENVGRYLRGEFPLQNQVDKDLGF